MAIGFVLITTEPGQEKMVRDTLESIDLVTSGWMLFGEYDLIARVQADDEYDLTRCIVEEIRPMKGIVDTKTLIGAELQSIECNLDSNSFAALWQPACLYLAIDSFNDDFWEFLPICDLANHHLAQQRNAGLDLGN